jgi:lipid II:glycine glycyltransferase (peptidoglycan interpeptide bridge formation enzyme)
VTEPLDLVENFTDADEWDAFVATAPAGHFFQSWDWGELQRGLGGRPHRIAAVSGGRLAGCVQVLVFSGQRKFAYVPRGPVADPGDGRIAETLLDAAIRLSAREETFLLRIEPQWAASVDLAQRLAQMGLTVSRQAIMPPRTLLVDLTPPADKIWAAFHTNTRNRIRLAQKLGVEIRVGADADVRVFADLFEETTSRHGLRLGRPEQFFLAQGLFGPSQAVRLYLARADGVDLAGIMVFVWGTTATYLWGASSASEGARKKNPNQLLHWTAMQWAREQGAATYDLFGIPDHDEAVLEAEYGRQTGGWWNLYRFKRGFGGRVHRHMGTFDYLFAGR